VRRAFPLLVLVLVLPSLGGCLFAPFLYTDVESDAETAQSNVRNAIPATEAWYADNGTYAGITLRRLRAKYDPSLEDVRFVAPLNRKTYCVESTAGEATYHKAGPGADIVRGHCR
jgi:hypothetical protein